MHHLFSGCRRFMCATFLVSLPLALVFAAPRANAVITIETAATLQDLDLPLDETIVIAAGGSLSIGAGVDLIWVETQDAEIGRITVRDGGALTVAGTAQLPVSFSSTHSAGWDGISVQTGATVLLEHCAIIEAGRGGGNALDVGAASFTARNLSITGGAGTGTGIVLSGAGNMGHFETLTVSGCTGSAVHQNTADMNPFFSGVTFTGNGANGVYINADTSSFANVFRTVGWTMTGAPYIINGWYRLGTDGVLNIGPGVRVEFAATSSAKQSLLAAMAEGTLNVEGTELAPVVFTSHEAVPAPGDWSEIAYNEDGAGVLRHCIVEYAGQWSPHSVRVAASGVTLDHVEVRNCVGNGIVLDEPAITPSLDNLYVHDTTGWPLTMQTQNMNPTIGDNLVFESNPEGNAIVVLADTSSVNTIDVTWTVNGTPYVITGWYLVGDGATFTVEPGVETLFAPNPSAALPSNIEVQQGGAMVAEGLPQSPIVFDSWRDTPAAGDWAFMKFAAGSAGALTHCRIGHGGTWSDASLIIGASDVVVQRTVIENGQGNGIRLENDGITPELRDVVVRNCTGWGIWQSRVNVAPSYENIALSGNSEGDAILISAPTASNTVTQAQHWHFAGAPYALSGWFEFTSGTNLTIDPGVIVQFATAPAALQTFIEINSGGTLQAMGTPGKRIVFTSSKNPPNSADWVSIILETGSSATLDNCTVEFPITALDIKTSAVTVRNSILTSGRDYGVWVRDGAQPVFENNHVEGFAKNGFLSWSPGSPVDMRNHWWGDPTGPYHSTLNPAGLGNAVSDGVLFDPWATEPIFGPTLFAWPRTVRVDLAGGGGFVAVDNTGTGELTWDATVQSGGEWLSIVPARGTAGGFSITAEPYDGQVQRVGRIGLTSTIPGVASQTIYVAQPGTGGEEGVHTADQDANKSINLNELLRIIQFFNAGGLHCGEDTEDGYAPGAGDTGCTTHQSDYDPQDWAIQLGELLRLIQFFNTSGYHVNVDGEDGFGAGLL